MNLALREDRLLETSEFVFRLLAAGMVFRLLLEIIPPTPGIQSGYAMFTAGILSFGGEGLAQGTTLVYEGTSYLISQDCLGWKSAAVFGGLVFASSPGTDELVKIWAFGAALIFFLNTVRVVSTVWLASHGVGFDLLHTVLWRWGMTAVVLGLWVSWRKGLISLYTERIILERR